MFEISFVAVVAVAGHRGDADDARDVGAGVRDELLGAVDHPFAVLQARARARVAGVRARLGLGQPERAERLARAQPRQPLALLLLGAEQVDRLGAERGVRAQRDRHRGVHPRQLLDRERVGERVAAAAAVLLGERDPHQVRARRACATISYGNAFVRSSSSATGATSPSANSRTVRRISSWSGERSKSIAARILTALGGRCHGRSSSIAARGPLPALDPRLPHPRAARIATAPTAPSGPTSTCPRAAGPHPVMVADPRRLLAASATARSLMRALAGRPPPPRLGGLEHRVPPPRRTGGGWPRDLRRRRRRDRPPRGTLDAPLDLDRVSPPRPLARAATSRCGPRAATGLPAGRPGRRRRAVRADARDRAGRRVATSTRAYAVWRGGAAAAR